MSEFTVGVVLTACAGREQNLRRTLRCLADLDTTPEVVVIVYDGCPPFDLSAVQFPVVEWEIEKHEPGKEQPRNVGFRVLREVAPRLNFCWFVDSDMVFESTVLDRYGEAHSAAQVDRILIGPYDWMEPGQTEPGGRAEMADCRWASFEESGPERIFIGDLGCSLGCFGGNLVYPVAAFEDVGGFHPDLYHGRCEDGELGLRAGAAGIPMSLVREARAWHVWHERDPMAMHAKNTRDVALLNSWHPEVQEKGFLLTEADGARFDFKCPECELIMNSHDYWNHMGGHRSGKPVEYADPASVREAL